MTYQQKDDFIKKLEKTALTTIVTSFITAFIMGISLFFWMKFQVEQTQKEVDALKAQKADLNYVIQVDKTNNEAHKNLLDGVNDLKQGQSAIYNYLIQNKSR